MKWTKRITDRSHLLITFLLITFLVCIHLVASEKHRQMKDLNGELYAWTVLAEGEPTIDFAIDSLTYIKDEEHTLQPFLDQLDSLLAGKDTVLNIVHLGDSHLQAGYYSGETMRLLQKQFGNAGRGWIAPFKLSKSNESEDFFINSYVKEWFTGRCIQRTPKCPWGIGGIGLETKAPTVDFRFGVTPEKGAGYGFNQAVLYRAAASMPMLPYGERKEEVEVFRSDSIVAPDIVTDTFRISHLTDTLQIESTRRQLGTDTLLPADDFINRYYGFSLTNGRTGLVYHSVGVNGAMFVNYTDENYIKQLALLQPALLIVSLGTNEAFGRNYMNGELTRQIDAFIRLVRRELPETKILLTTPAECYKRIRVKKRRSYVRNDNMSKAAGAIVKYAEENQLASWDLFKATGGFNSCKKWQNAGLFGRDRIHFTPEGYREQGKLLYKAFVRLKEDKEIKLEEITN